MAIIDSVSIASAPPGHQVQVNGIAGIAGIREILRQFLLRAFDPYRPELHYMRGPGPACRAKQAALRRAG